MKNERMVELRGDRTQKEVAEEIGIPVSTYAMVEAGHRFPRKPLQTKLVVYFGVTADELFFKQNSHVS